MSDTPKECMPTPDTTLEEQITSWNYPKNEREWWACKEIERLRAELKTVLDRETAMIERHDKKFAELEAQVAAMTGALQDSRIALIVVLGTVPVEAVIQPDLYKIIEDAIHAGKAALSPTSGAHILKIMEEYRDLLKSYTAMSAYIIERNRLAQEGSEERALTWLLMEGCRARIESGDQLLSALKVTI